MRIKGTRVCLVCVSCARISSLPFVWVVGVGAWVFFSGKQGCKLRGSKHAVGFTFNTVERLARMLPPLFLVRPVVLWGGWGWWCVWWVVCDLYSGCEHLLFSCCVVLFSFVGHSVDALASRADEGRCGLRYASGSWRASVIIRGCPNGGT